VGCCGVPETYLTPLTTGAHLVGMVESARTRLRCSVGFGKARGYPPREGGRHSKQAIRERWMSVPLCAF
jgi:hypothetical protein